MKKGVSGFMALCTCTNYSYTFIAMVIVVWDPTQKTTEVPYVDMPYYTCCWPCVRV